MDKDEELNKNIDEENLNELRAKHKERAEKIVQQCAFVDYPLSEKALQATRLIETMFEEITHELMMLLPSEARTGICLEQLESACNWAKKAIRIHDKLLTKIEDSHASSNPN